MPQDSAVFRVQPHIIWWWELAKGYVLWFFLPFLLSLLFMRFIPGWSFLGSLRLWFSEPSSSTIVLIVWSGLAGSSLYFAYRWANRTYYDFYRDRIEYSVSYVWAKRAVIKYADISNVILRKNVVERIADSGHLEFEGEGVETAAITTPTIKNPQEIYDRAIQLMQGARR